MNPYQPPPEIQTLSFNSINNIKDPSGLEMNKGECVDLCNFDVTLDGVLARRPGYTLDTAGDFRNGWNSKSDAYYVKNNIIYKHANTPISIASVIGETCFCDLGEYVAYSSASGTGFYPTLSEVYDNDLDREFCDSVSSFIATSMCYYNGRLYFACGESILASRSYKFNLYDYREYVVATYQTSVLGLFAVNTGIYVLTEDKVYFLGGSDAFNDDFTQKIAFPYGGVRGVNGQIVPASYIEPSRFGNAALFVTVQGVCVGYDNGEVLNLMINEVSLPLGKYCSCGVLQREGANMFITTLYDTNGTPFNSNSTVTLDISTEDA